MNKTAATATCKPRKEFLSGTEAVHQINTICRRAFQLNGTKAASTRFDAAARDLFQNLTGRKPTADELKEVNP